MGGGGDLGVSLGQTGSVRAPCRSQVLGSAAPHVVDERELQQGAEHKGWSEGVALIKKDIETCFNRGERYDYHEVIES